MLDAEEKTKTRVKTTTIILITCSIIAIAIVGYGISRRHNFFNELRLTAYTPTSQTSDLLVKTEPYLTPPSEWTKQTKHDAHTMIAYEAMDSQTTKDGQSFNPYLYVLKEQLHTNMSLAQFVEQDMRNTILPSFPDYNILEEAPIVTLGDRLARVVSGTYTEDGMLLRDKRLYLISPEHLTGYIVVGVALEETWEERGIGIIFDATFKSFMLPQDAEDVLIALRKKNSISYSDDEGTSIETAVIITDAPSYSSGMIAIYEYILNRFPDSTVLNEHILEQDNKLYQNMTVNVIEGDLLDLYFDVTDVF